MRNEMRKKWFVLVPLGIVLFIAIGGVVVQHLWNWLLPALFAWRQITFWQALGLLVLCRILFGRMGGGRGGFDRSYFFRRRWAHRWEHMTPEERERFRQKWGSRCGGFETPGTVAAGSKEPA
jgi:hypothetical protein